MAAVLRWLDNSPVSSIYEDNDVVSKVSQAKETGSLSSTEGMSEDRGDDSRPSEPSSVVAIEADLMEVSTKAVNTVKDWGSYLFSLGKVTSEQISKTAVQLKSILEDKILQAELAQEECVSGSQECRKLVDSVVAPWVGYNEEETMKSQILALSKDKRNFMRHPPTGAQFFFDYEINYPVARVMLVEDPNLKRMRFELVPKHLAEETFWRNYFYRVALVKQSVQLTSLARCSAGGEKNDKDTTEADDERRMQFEVAGVAESLCEADDTEETDLTLSACDFLTDDVEYSLDPGDMELDDFEFVSATDVDNNAGPG